MLSATKVNLIEKQLKLSLSPVVASPEANLMIAIIGRAVADILYSPYDMKARSYLQGEIPPAELVGIDSDYVRLLLKRIGIYV